MKDHFATFEELLDGPPDTTPQEEVTYPGSKKTKRSAGGQPADPWATIPSMVLTVRGQDVRFYTVGVLAKMLGRQPAALRKWERLRYIPPSGYRTPGRNGHGQYRLFTREQIEGVVAIAREEGIIGDSNRNVSATNFTTRVEELFVELKARQQAR